MFPCISSSGYFSFDTTFTKTAGNNHSVKMAQSPISQETFNVFSLNPVNLDIGSRVVSSMTQGFHDRHIGIWKAHIFPDNSDSHLRCGSLDPFDQQGPRTQVGLEVSQSQDFAYISIKALLVED